MNERVQAAIDAAMLQLAGDYVATDDCWNEHRRGLPIGTLGCPVVRQAIENVALVARVEALDQCFGQHDPKGSDALMMLVRVQGIGARPVSPREIAQKLAAVWSGIHVDWPVATVPFVDVAEDVLADAKRELEESMTSARTAR